MCDTEISVSYVWTPSPKAGRIPLVTESSDYTYIFVLSRGSLLGHKEGWQSYILYFVI